MRKPDFKLFRLHEQYNSHELEDGVCECGLVIPSENIEEDLKSIQGICLFIISTSQHVKSGFYFPKDPLVLSILSTLPMLPKDIASKVYNSIKPYIPKKVDRRDDNP